MADQETGSMADWRDKPPPKPVKDAADVYDKMHRAKSAATKRFNTADDNLKELMRKHQVARCPVREGTKNLVLTNEDKVKYEKPKDTAATEEEE
jgi:hypothetical protein